MPGVADLRVIVTGGNAGIGRAVAERFVEAGSSVAVFDVALDGWTESVLPIECDVADDERVRQAVAETAAMFGGIDVVVNNAGIGAAGDVTAQTDEEWHRLYDVNVVGMARVARAALPHLRRSPHPSII